VRSGLGGRLRFVISGGAPLAPDLSEFFTAVGIPVLEGYGLTETSPVITTNRLGRMKPGTVGPPLPGVEVRLAGDGEILTRGAHVMKGYWKAPEKTAETFAADGWLKTGDIGRLDADGFLLITDRKKELLVTAQGKNVAPQPIENALKGLPLVTQVALIGDRRPYLSALIVPDFEVLRRRAKQWGLDGMPLADLLRHPTLLREIEQGIHAVGGQFAHFEQIRRFTLLPHEFTLERGELTPTLKLKRRVILSHYAAEIEAMYEGHTAPAVAGAGREEGT
jgi:long-chain acyl-CoA synthetase